MRYLFTILIFIGLFLSSCTQKNNTSAESAVEDSVSAPISDSLSFPESWLGEWSGSLNIYTSEGLKQTLPMELHILPLDSADRFSWTIIYGEDKVEGARNYELQVKDRSAGLYIVDEKNTIELECYLIGDKLFSRYSVAENMILVTYELLGKDLTFEVIAGKDAAVSITGGAEHEGEEIPKVKALGVRTFQKATLNKVK